MLLFDKIAIIINSLLEITSVLILIHSLNGVQKKKHKGLVVFYICMLTYLTWVNLFAENKEIFAISYVILFAYVEWQYRMPVFEGIIITIGSIVSASVLEMIFFAPCRFLVFYHVRESIIYLIVVLATLGTILFLRKRIPIERIRKYIFHREKYSFIVIIICSLVVSYAIISFSGSKKLTFSEYLYIISCAVIIVLSFYKLNQYRYEAKIRMQYSEKYREVLELIRERQHKFSNQLNAIYAMHQLYDTYDELVSKQKEKTDELGKYIMPNNVIVLKNPIVIAHVYQKICEAADCDIQLETNFNCSIDGVSVPDIYLVEIIGTLFDNAMENIMMENKEAEMYLEITGRDDFVAVEVCNEHEYIPYQEWARFFERGYSSKGKERGLGLYHLKKLVNKYDGKILVENKTIEGKTFFSITVLLK